MVGLHGSQRRIMDLRRGSHKTGEVGKFSAAEGPMDGVHGREEVEDERRSLLPPAAKGGMAGKRKRPGRRKVRWNDCNGNKLVEVLEFHPRLVLVPDHRCYCWISFFLLFGAPSPIFLCS